MDEARDDPRPSGASEPGHEDPPERTSGLILETCYRHRDVTTGVHCTRCGRPICPECMRPAAVGYQCPECLAEARRTAPRRRWRVRFFLGRPGSVTTTIMVANVVIFLLEVLVGGGSLFGGPSTASLYRFGGLFGGGAASAVPGIANGQYWRLITAIFLHANLVHIAFNTYALYLFGYLIEGALGKGRFIAIYLVTGFLASVASFVFSSPLAVGVGASGAIFGLLGAWIAYNLRRRGTALASANLQWAFMIIAINLFLGFSIGNIDNFAHLGGLVSGVAAGAAAEGFGRRGVRTATRAAGFAILIVIGIALTALRVQALA